jgi:hypothetical protein
VNGARAALVPARGGVLPSIPLRPALVALAALSTLVGAYAFYQAIPTVWGVDAQRNLDAASALRDGSFGSVPLYLYSPLASALTVPALLVPPEVAIAAWFALKLAILLVGAAIATRGLAGIDRVLVAIALVTFLPVLYDLEVGNVTVFVLAGIALVAWNRDRYATGILLGLILATTPKPQLIPVLLWMLIANRKALVGAVATAVSATLVGVVVTGAPNYMTWFGILRAPSYLNNSDILNLAIWQQPLVILAVALVGSVVLFGLAMRHGYWPGLMAAMCVGLLLAPYTLIYAAGMLPAAAPASVRAAPVAALLILLVAPVGILMAFPGWVALVLVLAALVPVAAWPRRGTGPGM